MPFDPITLSQLGSQTLLVTFCILIWCHVLLDFPLQGDFMSKAKNIAAPPFGKTTAWIVMVSHGFLHAGPVVYITGNVWLGVAEWAAHVLIDISKCYNRISFGVDQALHIACKLLWVLIAFNTIKFTF